MSSKAYDLAVIGGGIVGLATARALLRKSRVRVVLLEAEDRLAMHQTGHNSGVIHSGLYYKPGSLKALNCTTGRETMYAFCAEHGIAHERCGKVVVATHPEQIPALDELERRGKANGLSGIRRISPEEIREHEPHIRGIDGLHVPETGIVDFKGVTEAFGRLVQVTRVVSAMVEVRLGRAQIDHVFRQRPPPADLAWRPRPPGTHGSQCPPRAARGPARC